MTASHAPNNQTDCAFLRNVKSPQFVFSRGSLRVCCGSVCPWMIVVSVLLRVLVSRGPYIMNPHNLHQNQRQHIVGVPHTPTASF